MSQEGRSHRVLGFVMKRVQMSTPFASVNSLAHMFSRSDTCIVLVENATECQYSDDWLYMRV